MMAYLMIIKDNFSYLSLKSYVVTPHLNHLDKMVQMRGHNICFYAKLTKFSLIRLLSLYFIISMPLYKKIRLL